MYCHHKFEQGTKEEEAVKIVRVHSLKSGGRFCINIPSLKSIWFEPDGSFHVDLYEPSLELTRCWATFGRTSHGIGLTRIG